MARIPDDVDRLKQTVSLQQKTGSDSNGTKLSLKCTYSRHSGAGRNP